MENNEYWLHNGTVLVVESENSRIGVTLFYGKSRQYSIKSSAEIKANKDKQIREMLKTIREAKKYVTPLHGCTHYL